MFLVDIKLTLILAAKHTSFIKLVYKLLLLSASGTELMCSFVCVTYVIYARQKSSLNALESQAKWSSSVKDKCKDTKRIAAYVEMCSSCCTSNLLYLDITAVRIAMVFNNFIYPILEHDSCANSLTSYIQY